MPLVIQQGVLPTPGKSIMQKFSGYSGQKSLYTNGLANCMGVVVHSPSHSVGCLAHIEYRDVGEYIVDFNIFLKSMIARINRASWLSTPTLQVGLFGNAAGSTNEIFTIKLAQSLVRLGIDRAEVTDQRNRPLHGQVDLSAGGAARIAGTYGGIVYSPTSGAVDCQSPFIAFPDLVDESGIEVTQLQLP